MIEVQVRFFAQAREATGCAAATHEIPERASVAEVAGILGAAYPALAPHLGRCAFAVNEGYARREDRLNAGDELAVIPPIGGG